MKQESKMALKQTLERIQELLSYSHAMTGIGEKKVNVRPYREEEMLLRQL